MKKTSFLKGLVLSMLVCTMMFSLTACATSLSGTYESTDGLVKQSFTFKDGNGVEVEAFGIEVEGTYEIEDDTIIITYSLGSLDYNLEKSFEKDGDSIFIDGAEFVKK